MSQSLVDFLFLYLFCTMGVAISVVLPVLAAAVRQIVKPKTDSDGSGGDAGTTSKGQFAQYVDRTWEKIKPIVVVGVFSLLVALLVLAFMRDKIVDWQSALIAGYLSDSTLQRISQAVL